jgi:hypothetical protein
MRTATSGATATRQAAPFVGRARAVDTPFVARCREAVSLTPFTGKSGKRHEILYKSTHVFTSLETLIDQALGAKASAVELEGVGQAIYGAIRAKYAHLVAATGVTLMELIERETRDESAENCAMVAYMRHPTPGNLAAFERALIAERLVTDQLLNLVAIERSQGAR